MNLPTAETMPRVALDSMNHTHEEELVLVQALVDALTQQPADIQLIQPLAEQWHTHTQQHFASEENLMQQTGFPAYSVHKGEHERVLAQITSYMLSLREGNILPLTLFLTNDWPQWFMLHVQTMDTATAMYASRCGL